MLIGESVIVRMDMGEIEHVEIYQTVSVFCHHCGFIYVLRGAHGSDSAGHYVSCHPCSILRRMAGEAIHQMITYCHLLTLL